MICCLDRSVTGLSGEGCFNSQRQRRTWPDLGWNLFSIKHWVFWLGSGLWGLGNCVYMMGLLPTSRWAVRRPQVFCEPRLDKVAETTAFNAMQRKHLRIWGDWRLFPCKKIIDALNYCIYSDFTHDWWILTSLPAQTQLLTMTCKAEQSRMSGVQSCRGEDTCSAQVRIYLSWPCNATTAL